MKKIVCFLMGLFVGLVLTSVCAVEADASNFQFFDFTYQFDYAQIAMPDGTFVEGKVDSWTDYENSDCVQVKINGDTYHTHYTNVVLVDE